MLEVIIRSDKFDWDDIDFSLITIDSSMVPTVGSTFIHRFNSGTLSVPFKFKVVNVEYVSKADYFNVCCAPKDIQYICKVYVEPVSENATYTRISRLLERDR